MKKGRMLRNLLALVMIFQMTSCGAAVETADAMVMNKTAPMERTTASAVYYDTEIAEEAGFGMTADAGTYSYASAGTTGVSQTADANAVNDLSERKIIKNATVRYETKTYDEFMNSL